ALQRMQRLGELQARARRCGFQDKEKQEIADLLDRIACEVNARGKVIETIEQRPGSLIDRVVALLNLCTTNSVTEGRLSAKAREKVIGYLAKPGFLTGYVAYLSHNPTGTKPDANTAMKSLMDSLTKAGITPETGLKNIAA